MATIEDFGVHVANLEADVVALVGGDFSLLTKAFSDLATVNTDIGEFITGWNNRPKMMASPCCSEIEACCTRISECLAKPTPKLAGIDGTKLTDFLLFVQKYLALILAIIGK